MSALPTILSPVVRATVLAITTGLDELVKRARERHTQGAERTRLEAHVVALKGHLHHLVDLAGGYDGKAG